MSFRPLASAEWRNPPRWMKSTQDKTCCLSRFLGSLRPRNDMSGGGFVHPHGLYSLRCMAMNHRRYSASSIVVPFGWNGSMPGTWRAAAAPTDTPVGGAFQPHGFYSQRPRNGTQAVPYGFADGYIFEPTDFKSGHVRRSNNCQLGKNCQLSTVNFPRRSVFSITPKCESSCLFSAWPSPGCI